MPADPDPDDWDIAEPRADALIESLRAFGYSPETAIADLLDNSISAGARTIDVDLHWDGADSIHLGHRRRPRDDRGRAVRRHAPRQHQPPRRPREESDLGRFGLGLKTASFSQARELTVSSAGDPSTTDRGPTLGPRLRRVEQQMATLEDATRRRRAPELRTRRGNRGDLDEVRPARRQGRPLATTRHRPDSTRPPRRVGQHLAATFHRFMVGRGKITIRVTGPRSSPGIRSWRATPPPRTLAAR